MTIRLEVRTLSVLSEETTDESQGMLSGRIQKRILFQPIHLDPPNRFEVSLEMFGLDI
jgi:hypothetical protein